MTGSVSALDELRSRLSAEWPSIARARAQAAATMDRLREEFTGDVPSGTNLVVFGSLGRGEFTQGSDVDWTLLLDGPADPKHWDAALSIERKLNDLGYKQPGVTGTFGGLTVSHELIHKIGGADDSNRNTTQRILLLLESAAIGDALVCRDVVRGVLRRYIEEDLPASGGSAFRVPHFLQNDVVRYWRTMTVDFAHKRRVRAGSGWALRTAKLRMSRKLMYAAGLLACYSCETSFSEDRDEDGQSRPRVIEFLEELTRKKPLDIVAQVVLQYFGELSGDGSALFAAYDEFLQLLDDADRRDHLESLPPEAADHDEEYEKVRMLGKQFQSALTHMFFDSHTPLPELTKRYGVF